MSTNHLNSTCAADRGAELAALLANFTGTEHWYSHSLNRTVTFTDGAKAFADEAQAYWLLDILATELATLARKHSIIFVTCAVKNGKADIHANRDKGQPNLWQRHIAFTDCPEGEWQLWMADGGPGDTIVIMVPSEY